MKDAKKKKKKSKDDSDSEKDKKAKKSKKKKDKKKEGTESENGKTSKGDKDGASDKNEEDSVASEDGIDDDAVLASAVQATKVFLLENDNYSNPQLIEFVTNQQMASSLKSFDKIHILVQAAITSNFFKQNEIQKFAPVVADIASGNKAMERHLIAALEGICVDKPKNFPVMIKQFYDEDALEEETILEWADDGRSEYTLKDLDEETRAKLRGEAEPLIVWLQEADSDDESEAE